MGMRFRMYGGGCGPRGFEFPEAIFAMGMGRGRHGWGGRHGLAATGVIGAAGAADRAMVGAVACSTPASFASSFSS